MGAPVSFARTFAVNRPLWQVVVALFLVFGVQSVRADVAGQAEISSFLPKGKTIVTASPAQLAAAVAAAITSSSNTLPPADLAASALEPYDDLIRTNRNTAAPLVAAAAINALIASGSDVNFSYDVAAITDSLIDVNNNEPNPAKEVLDTAGQGNVVKAALGAISDGAASNASLFATDQSIGQLLASDPYLEGTMLPPGTLMTILETGMTGITGSRGKAQPQAPEAAENFVEGLLSGAVPDNLAYPAFSMEILKKVSKNASVDELVAYAVGLADNSTQTTLVTLAATLIKAYPNATAKLTQGLTAVTPAGYHDEDARTAYIQALAGVELKNPAPVLMGAIFVDPYYAGQFTSGVFSALLASGSTGDKLLIASAVKMAAGAGKVLGGDGDVLTNVAEVYSEAIGNGELPVARAVSYATALMNGAVKSNTPALQFTGAATGGGGGRLNTGIGISYDTVTDLASIMDLFADGIATANPANAASEIGSLAAAIARFSGNRLFVNPNDNGISTPVAAFLGGTMADFVVQLGLDGTEQAAILKDIGKSITGVTNAIVDKQVAAAIASYQSYPAAGAITVDETAVTNL